MQHIRMPVLVDNHFMIVKMHIADRRNEHRIVGPERRMPIDMLLDHADRRIMRIRLIDDLAVLALRHAQDDARCQQILLVDGKSQGMAPPHIPLFFIENLHAARDGAEHMLLRAHQLDLCLMVKRKINADGRHKARENEHKNKHRRINQRKPRRHPHVPGTAQAQQTAPDTPSS